MKRNLPTRTPQLRSRWHRSIAIIGAGSAVFSLGAALPQDAAAHPTSDGQFTGLVSSIDPSDQQTQQIQEDAQALPQDLQAAIQRDLKLSPQEYLTRSVRAQNAARVSESIQSTTQGITATYSLDGNLVAAVSNDKAEAAAKAAGLATKRVTRTAAEIDAALLGTLDALKQQGLEKVILRAGAVGGDSINVTVLDGNADRVRTALKSSAVPVIVEEGGTRFETVGGSATPLATNGSAGGTAETAAYTLEGGRGINGSRLDTDSQDTFGRSVAICSNGFNATNAAGEDSMITAGHCVGSGAVISWFQEALDIGIRPKDRPQGADPEEYIGKLVQWRFGDTAAEGSEGTALLPQDYAYIDVKNPDATLSPTVFTWPEQYESNPDESITLRAYGPGITGEGLCRSGRTTGWQCGTITNPNGISYVGEPGGAVHRVRGVQARVCALSGDSGGSAVMGTTAVGVLSGGINDPDNNLDSDAQCLLDRNGLPGSSTFSAINPILDDREGYFVKLEIDAPTVALTAGGAGSYTAAGKAIPGDTIEVAVDGADPVTTKVTEDGTFTVNVNAAAGAEHTVKVLTRRDAVNASTPLEFTIAADGTVTGGDPAEPGTEPTPEPTPEPTTPAPTPEPTPEPTDPEEPSAPAAPVLSSPTQGQVIRGNQVTLIGTAVPNSTLQLTFTTGRSTYRGSAPIGSTGAYRLSLTLPTATYNASLVTVNQAGVASSATTRSFTVAGWSF